MPILLIRIDDEDTEIKIIPLNSRTFLKIEEKHVYYKEGHNFIDRAGLLAHIVKEPKMSRKDWGEIPSSMLTKIIRSIEYYLESIDEKQKALRWIYTELNVYEDEIDDLYRLMQDDRDDWLWNRIKDIEEHIKILKAKRDRIKNSLDAVKSDKVVFEEDKEVDYDVQPLQLDNKEKNT